MEKLTRFQFIVVVCLAAFVFAVLGAGATVSYIEGGGANSPNLGLMNSLVPNAARQVAASKDDAVVAAVAKTTPAVVAIVASKDVPVFEECVTSPFRGDRFLERFFDNNLKIPGRCQNGTKRQDVSSGSGFIVGSGGLIVTNKHVVSDTAADYTVFLNDGKKYSAKVLARDPLQDLAVVKITATGLPALQLGDSAHIRLGETVIAIGNALGEFSNTVSVGVISGLQRSITASGQGVGNEDLTELIQTDAAINPGNSGGPLLNLAGQVIGINTAIVEGAQNIGFAIPINQVSRSIQSVEKTGRIIYPFIGVRYINITADIKDQEKLPVSEGAWLQGDKGSPAIVSGSPAEKAGLKEGDIIIQINGQKLDAEHTLASIIQEHNVGDTLSIIYLRNGVRQTTSVTLVERK